MGRRADVKIPADAQTIDATDRFITPGIIDTNVHLVLMIVPEFYAKYEGHLEEIALQSAQVALKYGVTTVRDSWGPLQALLNVRDRINRGEVVGARTLVAGNIVGLSGPFGANFLGGERSGVSGRPSAPYQRALGSQHGAETPAHDAR